MLNELKEKHALFLKFGLFSSARAIAKKINYLQGAKK